MNVVARRSLGAGLMQRLATDRGLWKEIIAGFVFATYACSFFFLALAMLEVKRGAATGAVIDLLLALYFLFQVSVLFQLARVVERRRQSTPIAFADRRRRRP